MSFQDDETLRLQLEASFFEALESCLPSDAPQMLLVSECLEGIFSVAVRCSPSGLDARKISEHERVIERLSDYFEEPSSDFKGRELQIEVRETSVKFTFF